MPFQRATKKQAKLRMALIGPSGSGKTYSALAIASHLGRRVALIDTERGSASKYADEFEFDVLELDSFHPQRYIDGIREAEQAGYDVLIIDSLSHAWAGKDGALELVDRAAKRSQSNNTFGAWREVTPLHNALVDTMLQAKCHVIVTMRAKTEYVQERDEKTGRTVIRKVGLQPVQRDGLEYEFDVVGDMDADNNLIVTKSRCKALNGAVFSKPGKDVADILRAWLSDGAPGEETAPAQASSQGQSATATTNGTTEPTITEAQRRRLLAIMAQHGKSHPDLKAELERRGIGSSKDIPVRLYDELCRWAETPTNSGPTGSGLAPESPWPTISEAEWRSLVETGRANGVKPVDLLSVAQGYVHGIQRPGQIPAFLIPLLEQRAHGQRVTDCIGTPPDTPDGSETERRVTRRELYDLLAYAWERGIGQFAVLDVLTGAEILTPFDVTLDTLKASDLDRAREAIARAGEAARQEEAEAEHALAEMGAESP